MGECDGDICPWNEMSSLGAGMSVEEEEADRNVDCIANHADIMKQMGVNIFMHQGGLGLAVYNGGTGGAG